LAASLDDDVIWPVVFVYMDIVGDPFRVCTWLYPIIPIGSSDPLLNSQTFIGIGQNNPITEISSIKDSMTGSESVEFKLSIPVDHSAALENIIGDKSKWRGRIACIWYAHMNETRQLIDEPIRLKRGRLSQAIFNCSPEIQTLNLIMESHQSNISQPRRRNYLQQKTIDPLDESPSASIAIANGPSGTGLGQPQSQSNNYNINYDYDIP
jgi:hypothetical protein